MPARSNALLRTSPEAETTAGPRLGLYVHWPYCLAKCPYCDFNSHVAASIDTAAWRAAYRQALADAVAQADINDRLDTIFFGGGTPSLMDPAVVGDVIATADRLIGLAEDVEITLEANPTSFEARKFRDFRAAGVNRVSIGVQALDDGDLRRLGRQHTAREAVAAYEEAARIFDRTSFDLIYARQGQTVPAWEAELKAALKIAGDHLSLYQLTIEPGTIFARRHRAGRLTGLPDDDIAAEMFRLTGEICAAEGLRRYEVSNHARPGAECRHNLIYWRYRDYLGIGPGAHGRFWRDGTRLASEAVRDPARWLRSVQEGLAQARLERVAPADAAAEYLIMGLRLAEGISLSRHAALAGQPLDDRVLEALAEDGLVTREADRLRATERGILVLDSVLTRLLPA